MQELGSKPNNILLPPASPIGGVAFPVRLRDGVQIATQGKQGIERMLSLLPSEQVGKYREVFRFCEAQIEDVLVGGGAISASGELFKPDLPVELRDELRDELAIYSTVSYFKEAYGALTEEKLHPNNFVWFLSSDFIKNVGYEKRDFKTPEWQGIEGKHIRGRAFQGIYLIRQNEVIRIEPLIQALGRFVDKEMVNVGLEKLINPRSVAGQILYTASDLYGLGQITINRDQEVSWRRFDAAYRHERYRQASKKGL